MAGNNHRPNLGANLTPLQMMAFWVAALCTLLMLPQIWLASGWLANTLLRPEFGAEITWYLRPVVFICLLMAGLYAARATLASSFALVALAAITKLPLF